MPMPVDVLSVPVEVDRVLASGAIGCRSSDCSVLPVVDTRRDLATTQQPAKPVAPSGATVIFDDAESRTALRLSSTDGEGHFAGGA